MARWMKWQPTMVLMALLISATGADAASLASGGEPQLLPGDRVLLGTVEAVASDQARIDTGEMQPRFIPMNVRKEKGLPDLKKGDRVEITVNDQNLLVDVHLVGEAGQHRVVQGQLAQSLVTGHDRAVIRTTGGQEESHGVRPVARSKVASIPVGVDAVFLIDELDRIVDVTFGSREAVERAGELWKKKTPLKGNFTRVVGIVREPFKENRIAIQTEEGAEQAYDVRPVMHAAVSTLSANDPVVLLIDEENKVIDVAIPPHAERKP